MDTATLLIAHAVLETGGIRAAAARLGRPAGSVSAGLRRMEQALAVPLARREAGRLVPTLEAASRAEDFAAAAILIRTLVSTGQPAEGPGPAISLAALERFAMVAASGSIRSAASRLGLGQPHVTRQIATLERDLGCRLMDRTASGITCTAAGAALIPQAEALLDIWQRLSRAADARFRRNAATWRLGSVMPLGPESEIASMLAALTATWHGAHPRQPLFLSSATADELIAGLRSRRFDAVLLDLETYPADFEGCLVSRAPLALAGASEDLAAGGQALRDLLLARPIAVPSLRSGLRLQAKLFLEQTLSERDLDRLRIVDIDSIPVLINLVTNHGYLSILPESSLRRLRDAPPLWPLRAGLYQTLSLVWLKEPLSRQIAEAMLELLGRHGHPARQQAAATDSKDSRKRRS